MDIRHVELTGSHVSVHHQDIKEVVRVAAETVLGMRLSRRVYIEIDIVPLPPESGFIFSASQFGRPRDFEITLSSFSTFDELVLVVCHEMAHVEQYARLRLRDCSVGHLKKWLGRTIDTRELPETDWPWEMEAYSREEAICAAVRARLAR